MDTVKVNIFWFRRDLRVFDNTALYHALQEDIPLVPIFIFDKNILDQLEDKKDRRVEFIYKVLGEIQQYLEKSGSTIRVYYGLPTEVFRSLLSEYNINKVFANHDYESYALERDASIASFLKSVSVPFSTFKDQVIFEKGEIIKEDGKPYTVFTPYSRKWKGSLREHHYRSYPSENYMDRIFKQKPSSFPSLETMGFKAVGMPFPPAILDKQLVAQYTTNRDFPALEGTSKMGLHLRFGTVSIRQLVQHAIELNETYLNELIWRDFYHSIVWHFPRVNQGKSFKPEYDLIAWKNDESDFESWCTGNTGYPLVDAGMRELNQTGFMHNRVRMVVASFLTKHLLIDWRWGEAYFAKKLLDFDFAANNGGWQWAAGSGCDAAPYFRVFNPTLQMQKFDPGTSYIRKWVPEWGTDRYPKPLVNHEYARKRVLQVYGEALKK